MALNRQVITAVDAAVSLNTGVGGVPSPGHTRLTLDPGQIVYNVGSNDLFLFHNGALQVLGENYIEEDATHVVMLLLLDAIGPQIDVVELRTAGQGSSSFIEPPTFFQQASAPRRPDNFGGIFGFDL